jgi:putative nucleotidyltransferase with HDIG domain
MRWAGARSRASGETVLAALLHDIGHLLEPDDETGRVDHDRVGAAFLRKLGFDSKIVGLVAGYVGAKRYLTAADPEYYARLFQVSKLTLQEQGGPMSPAFEQDPLFRAKLELRNWDEQANEAGLSTDGL